MLRRTLWTALAVALAVAAPAGCGGSNDEDSGSTPPPEAKFSHFPPGSGQTVDELRAGMAQGPVLSPTVSVVEKGRNRIGFALFDRARKQITGASVALYTASAKGTGVSGPYPARSESLVVMPQFVARTTSQDPDAAKSVYVADVPLRMNGLPAIVAVARLDGRLVASSAAPVGKWGGAPAQPPRVGEKAIKISTPTAASVGGDLSKIDTRVPPSDQHDVDFADVLGKKPVVLTFATPQLCQSRVCGPVVDVAEQVKASWGDRAAFIHMEIYEDNKISNPPKFRPQVTKWRLPSEPWTFVVGKDGRVKARFEGAVSVVELERALQQTIKS
ncbi:hypothetical protein BH20ACT18_BH20ACT18_09250 [soil metagenome]